MLQNLNGFRLSFCWLRRHKFLIISVAYWLICGFFPLLTIVFEFGLDKGLLYAKFYSPLYFYPLIFGFIAVYFMLRPVFFLFNLDKNLRFNLSSKSIILFILMTTFMISILEFNGNPAIWEVKDNAISETISDLNSSNHSRNINNEDEFLNHFRNPPEDPMDNRIDVADQIEREKEEIRKAGEEFNEIITISSRSIRNWSFTKYLYFVSFVIQVLAVFFEFIAISFISMPRFRENYISGLRKDSQKFKNREMRLRKHLVLLSCSLTFTLAWLYMRIPFDGDKMNLYGIDLISISSATIVTD